MKRILFISFILVITGCSSSGLVNLDICKKHVEDYYENGSYDKEMNNIIDNAINKLSNVELTEHSAIVFDVDETLLSNIEHMKEMGYGYQPELWHEWVLKADANVISQTKRLYDWAVDNNVHVILITGRSADEYNATLKNLNDDGITVIDTLITRSAATQNATAVNYKEMERTLLTKNGYNIIACVGDQQSDIEGNYTGLKIKLPNYVYLIE